ncbi:MAG: hypothetical protein HY785_20135 [Oscillatoriophycideae cyanobacterium NC_groundwater_1537_Pr4_S-0.65um_50_18]|nr:hypothetical protein [Oscillatoriophycideae cyanobacterium NC_groundwater_1537_Pr4_S-0.65um_50_18]
MAEICIAVNSEVRIGVVQSLRQVKESVPGDRRNPVRADRVSAAIPPSIPKLLRINV